MPQAGEVLIKQIYMSLDPAMRGWMEDDLDSYIPPVALGETMRSMGVGIVLKSYNLAGFPVGTKLSGFYRGSNCQS